MIINTITEEATVIAEEIKKKVDECSIKMRNSPAE